MTSTCTTAARSLRACARLNLRQARAARLAARDRLAAHHLATALQCRADANLLCSSVR